MTLARYIDALTDFGHPVAKHLRPGLPSSVISSFEEESGIQLPQEIRELFRAFDGTEFLEGVLLGHGQIIDGFHLMKVSEISADKEIIDEVVEDFPFLAGESHPFDSREMLPIMADGLGNHIVVDVSERSETFGSIGFFHHAGESTAEAFPSFQVLIEAHFEALKSGAYSLSDEGYIEAEFDKLEQVLTKHRK
ncbi:MAG: SMI1/KNR4 family protein [Verrucomicrobiota bacterium]